MAAPTRGDRSSCSFIAEAESIGGDQPFTPELLVELGRLVPADDVTYCELDRVRRRRLLIVDRPDDEDGGVELDDETRWRVLLEEHPSCLRQQEGDFGAVRVSDFLTQARAAPDLALRQLLRTRHRARARGADSLAALAHEDVSLRSQQRQSRLHRARPAPPRSAAAASGADLLAARTRRLLSSALAELDRVDEHDPRGVILLGLGEVEFASPPIERLLREFFPARSGGRLPAALVEWLESGDTEPLIRRRGERRLTVQQADGALLLEERHEGIELTTANARYSPGSPGQDEPGDRTPTLACTETVGKHLENVYAKLGVSTRTAAVARFLGLMDTEAS